MSSDDLVSAEQPEAVPAIATADPTSGGSSAGLGGGSDSPSSFTTGDGGQSFAGLEGRAPAAAAHAVAERGEVARSAVAQVVVPLAKAVNTGLHHIEIALEPAALGRVEVRLDFAADGRISALFLADTPAALDALKGDARALERALTDAGVKADAGSLDFGLREQGSGSGGHHELSGRPAHGGGDPTLSPGDAPSPGPDPAFVRPGRPARHPRLTFSQGDKTMILQGTSATTSANATGQAGTDQSKLGDDLNKFLTLLVTQLQNQDPLQPLDANQFTSQLVQFASVEQQIHQNANLEKLVAAQKSAEFASTIGYLGTTVEADGSTLPLQDGEAHALYSLAATADQATLTIKDQAGKTVYSAPVDPSSGRHEVTWDGRTSDGKTAPDGTYTFQVAAKKRNGDVVEAVQGFAGRVTGVSTGDDGSARLEMGNLPLPLADVRAVTQKQSTALAEATAS